MTRIRAEPLMTFGAVASLLAAGAGAFVGAPTAAVVGIGFVGLGWSSVRASRALSETDAGPSMSSVRAVALAGLLVMTAIGGPMTSPATASGPQVTTNPECSLTENVVFGLTFGNVNSNCLTVTNQDSTNASQQRVYSMAAATTAQLQVYSQGINNSQSQIKIGAQMRAESAIAEARQNGKTKAEAKAAAVAAVQDYFASRQKNLLEVNNEVVEGLNGVENVSDASVGDDYVHLHKSAANYQSDIEVRNKTVTLANGSTATALYLRGYNSAGNYPIKVGLTSSNIYEVRSPNGANLDPIKYRSQEASDQWTFFQNARTEVEGNVQTLTENIWPEFEAGRLNATDVLSRNNKVYRLGVDAAGENGTYANGLAAYGALGIESPDLNQTGTITVGYKGTNYTGMLYTTSPPPGGSWEAGRTYNGSTLEGSQFVYTTEAKEVSLEDGEFTVEAITSQDGEQRANISTVNYKVQTVNATEYAESNERLAELLTEYESRQSLAGPGGDLFGSGGGVPPVAVAFVGGAILILLLRD